MLEYYKFKTIHELFVKGREKEALVHLAELQKRYITICDANTNMKIQLQEYEDVLYLARNLVHDGQVYWLRTGSIKQGPFCPNCYEAEGLLIRLGADGELRQCQRCATEFALHRHPALSQMPKAACGAQGREASVTHADKDSMAAKAMSMVASETMHHDAVRYTQNASPAGALQQYSQAAELAQGSSRAGGNYKKVIPFNALGG